MFLQAFFGIGAVLLTVFSFTPQLIKSFKTKSVNDLSWWMIIIYGASAVFWTVYGFLIQDPALIIADIVVLIQTFVLVWLKIKHQK